MKNANECQNCVIIYNRMKLPIITQHPSRSFSLDSSFYGINLTLSKQILVVTLKLKLVKASLYPILECHL